MRFILILCVFSLSYVTGLSQKVQKKSQSTVKLIKWSSENCDQTYDPGRLQNRLTRLDTRDGIVSITVNFTENCCAQFNPVIEFKGDKLYLYPYKEYGDEICECDCCFSINYEISGIEAKNLKVYFKDEEVKLSEDHYRTREPTFVWHNGTKINRINKYGFQEGIWKEFYENGDLKKVTHYPELSLYYEPRFEWSKSYYPSGRLKNYSRKDTIESWFEDGELKGQFINYSSKDTVFEKGIMKHSNRQLKERFLQRQYNTVFKSEFDSGTDKTGRELDYLYKEEYYENGNRKFLHASDTSFTWYESGQLKEKQYRNGTTEYNEQGQLIKKSFHWKAPGTKSWGDLDCSMYIEYYPHKEIKEIHFVRDEISKDDKSIASGVHYYWKWDQALNLIETPEDWKEEYPWINISEIKVPIKK
ncbi:MAG: hypothetical protein ACK5RG_17000 [Cyclobacteriaceae bacterium]